MLISAVTQAQTTYTYEGKSYSVVVGPKGGKYIILADGTKHYLATDRKTVIQGNNVLYNGVSYPIVIGPKGGKYFIYKGSKVYLKK